MPTCPHGDFATKRCLAPDDWVFTEECNTCMFRGKSVAAANNCSPTKRGERIFADASKLINGARQTSYGSPEDSFAIIATRWSQFLKGRYDADFQLTAADVAFMMVDLKLARECNQRKRDNMADAAGYIGIYDDLQAIKK